MTILDIVTLRTLAWPADCNSKEKIISACSFFCWGSFWSINQLKSHSKRSKILNMLVQGTILKPPDIRYFILTVIGYLNIVCVGRSCPDSEPWSKSLCRGEAFYGMRLGHILFTCRIGRLLIVVWGVNFAVTVLAWGNGHKARCHLLVLGELLFALVLVWRIRSVFCAVFSRFCLLFTVLLG